MWLTQPRSQPLCNKPYWLLVEWTLLLTTLVYPYQNHFWKPPRKTGTANTTSWQKDPSWYPRQQPKCLLSKTWVETLFTSPPRTQFLLDLITLPTQLLKLIRPTKCASWLWNWVITASRSTASTPMVLCKVPVFSPPGGVPTVPPHTGSRKKT